MRASELIQTQFANPVFFEANYVTQDTMSKSSSDQPLQKDVDYYIENGRWVFTETYHRKRGYCCGNACRHCPYEHVAVPNERDPKNPSEKN
jgi:hypothetical protein